MRPGSPYAMPASAAGSFSGACRSTSALPQVVDGAPSCCPPHDGNGRREVVASDPGGLRTPDRSQQEDILSSLDGLDEPFFRMRAVRDAAGGIVDFEYAFCNRAALALLGRAREEVLGKRLLDLFPSHRRNGLFDTFVKVTETGEPLRLEFPFEEGGVVGEFEVVVSRVGDGYVLAGHDISQRKRLERELVTLKDQLQAALTSRVAIEQAKGFVAAQLRMDPETAYIGIRRYARGHDMRIGDVARALVAGEIVLREW